LFAYGFRPFFLLAGLYGALVVPLWLGAYAGWLDLTPALPLALWHGHEMLFGYGTAVLAGFLLTATPSWGGAAAVRGLPLVGLAGLWLAGRLTVTFGGAAPTLAAVIDLAFLPAVAVATAPALQAAAPRNLVFLSLLGALALANLAVHVDALGLVIDVGSPALVAALDLFILMIGLMGGRIVPAFTANVLKARGQPVTVRLFGLLDRLAVASLVAVLLVDLIGVSPAAGVVALLAAFLNGLRMTGWATICERAELAADSPDKQIDRLRGVWIIARKQRAHVVADARHALQPALLVQHALDRVGVYAIGADQMEYDARVERAAARAHGKAIEAGEAHGTVPATSVPNRAYDGAAADDHAALGNFRRDLRQHARDVLVGQAASASRAFSMSRFFANLPRALEIESIAALRLLT
jgi:hypothetical protein